MSAHTTNMSLAEAFPLPFVFTHTTGDLAFKIEFHDDDHKYYRVTLSPSNPDDNRVRIYYSEVEFAANVDFIISAPMNIMDRLPHHHLLTKAAQNEISTLFYGAFYRNVKSCHDLQAKPPLVIHYPLNKTHSLRATAVFLPLEIIVTIRSFLTGEGNSHESIDPKHTWKSVAIMKIHDYLLEGGDVNNVNAIRLRWTTTEKNGEKIDETWFCSNTIRAAMIMIDSLWRSVRDSVSEEFMQEEVIQLSKANQLLNPLIIKTYSENPKSVEFFFDKLFNVTYDEQGVAQVSLEYYEKVAQ